MNVLNFVKPKAKLPRNGFDMSQRHLFSAKAGQLLPILSLDCVPGDFHDINVLEMARAMQVHTDAFCRMKQNFDFYFVPYSQLWHNFSAFISQKQEYRSTLDVGTGYANAPHISLNNVLDGISRLDQEGLTDVHGFNYADGAYKLLDLLGYGSFQHIHNTSDVYDGYGSLNVNLFRAAAYQKIFADYYRQPFYDLTLGSSNANYVNSYNFDNVSNQSGILSFLPNWFMLHYRQWKKDMFTGLIPSVQFGDVSFVDLGSFELHTNSFTSSSQNLTVKPSGSSAAGNVVAGTSNNSTSFTSSARIDVYEILKAQALQKWKENTARAGSHLRDNFKAHYGVTPSYEENVLCEFIGSFDSPLTIDEVVSQSLSNDGLGEIGGKGIGTASGHIKFSTNDFGVLMCIYSIVPTAEYNAQMLDRANSNVEHFDFWNPEFDNVGLEALPYAQLSLLNINSLSPTDGDNYASTVLGYAPRNLYLKTAVDKVHGMFQSLYYREDESSQYEWKNGVFSHWAIPRRLVGNQGFALKDYYISPKDLDTIFVTEADSSETTDQFIVNCNFDVKSVRNMPVLGLPNW